MFELRTENDFSDYAPFYVNLVPSVVAL